MKKSPHQSATILLLAAIATMIMRDISVQAAPSSPNPVLVELFTSEGCSSCPPADILLTRLQADKNLKVITISEHVDYWDYLGWRDPFSKASLTERQRAYAGQFGRGCYTPQMVVDGRYEFVGSDSRKAYETIASLSALPKARLSVQAGSARTSGNTSIEDIPIAIDYAPLIESAKQQQQQQKLANKADLMLATVSNHETSVVTAGENSGRTLAHSAVVLELRRLAEVDISQSFNKTFLVKANKQASRNIYFVAFVQMHNGRKITAAAASQ